MGGAGVCGIEFLLIYLAGIVDICIGRAARLAQLGVSEGLVMWRVIWAEFHFVITDTIEVFSEITPILWKVDSCDSRHSSPFVNAQASAQTSIGADFMPTASLSTLTVTNAYV